MAVSALARLSFHYDREVLREAAIGGIRAYGRQIARYPRAFAKSLTRSICSGKARLNSLLSDAPILDWRPCGSL